MLKHSISVLFLAALTFSPLPVATGPALAQRCTAAANYCPPTSGDGSTYRCSTEMGHLRRVYEDELEAVDDPLRVSVMPVCIGESYGVMRSDGNAGALRQVIADSDAMTEALFHKNFTSDDVVGIRMTGEDAVILYVHPFHQR